MNTISGYILTSILGWRIKGKFPNLPKSIIIFAPHTSWYDGLIGKLYLNEVGITHKFLSKKELFHFPMNIVMKWYGSIPVTKSKEDIFNLTEMLSKSNSLHIVVSPEGTRKKASEWKKGFYFIAKRAEIPIVVGFIDYSKKEIGIITRINHSESVTDIMTFLSNTYTPSMAKFPEKFIL